MNEKLLAWVENLTGKKILTLVNSEGSFVVDISDENVYGYDENSKDLIVSKISSTIHQSEGSVIIRHFISDKEIHLYGFIIEDQKVIALPADIFEDAYGETTDSVIFKSVNKKWLI